MERLTLVLPDPAWERQAEDYRQAYLDSGECHINGSSEMERIRSTANGWIESTLCKNCRYRKSILRRPPFLRCGNRMDELWEPFRSGTG